MANYKRKRTGLKETEASDLTLAEHMERGLIDILQKRVVIVDTLSRKAETDEQVGE